MITGSANKTDRIRTFAAYLLERKLADRAMLSRVAKFRSLLDMRIGTLCVMRGRMTLAQMYEVLTEQAEVNRKFGEIAVEKGILTAVQVDEILRYKEDSFALFVDSIRILNAMDPEDLDQALTECFGGEIFPQPPAPAPMREAAEVLEPMEHSSGPVTTAAQLRVSLRRIKQLATMPKALAQALQMLKDPEVKPQALADVLSIDQGLSTQILRLVNSAFFGVRGEIASISRAVITLGFRAVRQVVTAMLVIDKFKGIPREEVEDIWWHTVLCSQWSRILSERLRLGGVEDANVAGLLHNIGKPVLLQNFPEEMPQVRALVRKGLSPGEAEQRVFGMTHAEIGSFLCHFWSFPEPLIQAVHHHHSGPEMLAKSGTLPLTVMVAAGCRLAHLVPTPEQIPKIPELGTDWFDAHKLNEETLTEIAPEVFEHSQKMRDLLL